MASDSEKLDNLIDVMNQLKELEKMLKDTNNNDRVIMGLILALIRNTSVPDVTILPNNRTMAQA